ncbi:MAG: 3-hydroxyacyl-CoA dehydrogenase family protein [Planctomyces sp.]|nr:3-hydroxyacyl-CoA dehydrogenase family protein [Planctomyces sp.]
MEMHQPKPEIQDSRPSNSSESLHSQGTVSIIGAGVMGRGIAAACVRAGISVRISDSNFAAAKEAVAQIVTACDSRASQYPRFVDPAARPLISLATDDEEIADADLIIEAVPEDFALKTAILARIEPHLRSGTIMASNSSSLSIAQLSAALQAPGRFCGMHFCHPVIERPLVEVIHTDLTSRETLRQVCAFATSLRMIPAVMRDSPGFLLNRLLVPYLNETLELLLDGADIEEIDRAATAFGMPQGPLALFDEFGLDVAIAVGRSLYRAFPERIVPSELLIAMYKSGRLGRKSGGGFYQTQCDASAGRLDPHIMDLIRERRRGENSLSENAITRRLFLPFLLEATRTLQESLVACPLVVDAVLRSGLGMSGSGSGIFAWANSIGARTLVQWLQPLHALGNRFEPTSLLLDAARKNRSFSGTDRNAA